MIYCKTCFYPNTKPDLEFNKEGICNACVSFENRKKINWKNREKDFLKIIKIIKKKKTSDYDCIIPVSGGKDSTWQVIKALEYNLKPLCVNSRTCDLSDLGRKNLDNIRELGADLIEVAPNSIIRRKLNKIGLLEVGDISWPEHAAMFTIPFNIALKFKIKFMLWGENSQNEYGGPSFATNNSTLDRSWLEEFGGLLGLRISDLYNRYNIQINDLLPYIYPNETELKKINLKSLFLGHFFPWDGHQNAQVANKRGFKFYDKLVEGTPVSYENLDNYQTGIHDYFKFLKYGFGRTTDIMNNLLRRKIITKKDAKKNIEKYDGNFPYTYLGLEIKDILKKIDVSIDEFNKCCDRFTNKKIFKCDNRGNLIKEKYQVIKNF
jgi:N-acetyl sugar amidotransferase